MLEFLIISACAYGAKCDILLNAYAQYNIDFKKQIELVQTRIENRLGDYSFFLTYSVAAANAYISDRPIPFKITNRTIVNLSPINNSIMVIWSYGF